jgi:membrane protein DedA with SNARE-associated domain/rhodanese-related sulfurtransferase
MRHLIELIEQYGLSFVFLNVLVEQAGVPLPAYPTLIVAGALLAQADYSLLQVLAAAVAASLAADLAWFAGGARFGRPVLRTLCRISLSPDSCVRQTESIYTRWGAPSLLVAKFVPGFSAVATALAGSVGTRWPVFTLFDSLGALLWAGVAVALGSIFASAVRDILDVLEALGKAGLLVIAGGFGLVILLKWWQRQRFYRQLRMDRITVDELRAMLDEGRAPSVLDVRSASSQLRDGRIPGATSVDSHNLHHAISSLTPAGEVVVYCACPNEASAALIAKQLMKLGFSRVRPLQGGIDAWIAAGYVVDH